MPRAQWFSGPVAEFAWPGVPWSARIQIRCRWSLLDHVGSIGLALDRVETVSIYKVGYLSSKVRNSLAEKKTNSWEHVRHTVKVHFWQKLLGTVGNVQRLERPWWPGGWLEIQAQPAAQIHTYYIPIDLVCTTYLLYNTYVTIHI